MEHLASRNPLLLHLLVLLLHVTCGFAGGEGRAGDAETASLSLSTHDVKLVAGKHENATVFLLLRGTPRECLSVNFTYDPDDAIIAPLDPLLICPDPPSHTPIHRAPPHHKTCTDCARNTREHVSLSSHYPRPGTLSLLLKGWAYRVGSRQRASSGGGEVVANVSVEVVSRRVGKILVDVTTNDSRVGASDAFVRVSVVHARALDVASDVLGWMYTIVWDVSSMPQLWLNWRRKSVEGLSLDNVALSVVAFLYYALFNLAFFYCPFIKDQFKERYPTSVNHVHPNDVFFATYALSIEVLLAVQCFVYGRNKGMRVSWPCVGLVGASVLAVGVACVLAGVGVLWWLDVFYLMSYLKLVITPLRYMPQVYVIYLVKSTRGFSIAGAAMDFMGGLMSLGQMFLLAANSDDYLSVFNNFSKFGLGIVTLIFNIIYFCQDCYYHSREGK